MSNRLRQFSFLITLTVFVGCYPEGPENVNDLDLVVTRYDKAFDFDRVSTYAMPDQVVKITGNAVNGDDVEFVDMTYADQILEGIRDNLNAYGWSEVPADQADVIILPSAMTSTSFIWYYDWWYWDWWYPYDWWGWYYPYSIYGGSYTSGSHSISGSLEKEHT